MSTFRECMGKVPSDLYVLMGSSAIGGTALEQIHPRTHYGISTSQYYAAAHPPGRYLCVPKEQSCIACSSHSMQYRNATSLAVELKRLHLLIVPSISLQLANHTDIGCVAFRRTMLTPRYVNTWVICRPSPTFRVSSKCNLNK